MSYGKPKYDAEALAWADVRDGVRTTLRGIMRRAELRVLESFYNEVFAPAVARGEIVELETTPAELRKMLLAEVYAQRELEAGDAANTSA